MIDTPLSAHPEYYFRDGNFCIVAEQVVFRLYAGQWARRSSVLKSMLEQPSNNPHNTGVSPILRECQHTLWMEGPVGANDIEALCRYIYDDVELDAEGNLDTTLGVLLCAHVWQMPPLRRRAHRVLRRMWSDDVNGLGWGGSEGQTRHIIESSAKVVKYVCWTKSPQDLILLPAAYYFLAITRGYKHLSGLTGKENKNLLAHIAALNDMYYDILRGVVHDVLYVEHKVGEDRAQHFLNCRDPQRWRAALESWTDARFASYGRMMGGQEQVFDPLEELASTTELERSLEIFAQDTCAACAERLRKYLKRKRYELWEYLPQRFDLPKWKELRESLSGWVPDPEDM